MDIKILVVFVVVLGVVSCAPGSYHKSVLKRDALNAADAKAAALAAAQGLAPAPKTKEAPAQAQPTSTPGKHRFGNRTRKPLTRAVDQQEPQEKAVGEKEAAPTPVVQEAKPSHPVSGAVSKAKIPLIGRRRPTTTKAPDVE